MTTAMSLFITARAGLKTQTLVLVILTVYPVYRQVSVWQLVPSAAPVLELFGMEQPSRLPQTSTVPTLLPPYRVHLRTFVWRQIPRAMFSSAPDDKTVYTSHKRWELKAMAPAVSAVPIPHLVLVRLYQRFQVTP